jgi:hypothetical protein
MRSSLPDTTCLRIMLPWLAAELSSQVRARHHDIHPTTSDSRLVLLVSALQHSTESAQWCSSTLCVASLILVSTCLIFPCSSAHPDTVLLKSIRQSRVTGVLDVTNFGTLSRVTEDLDEYTFRHGRFKISVQGCSEQVSLAADTLPTIFSPFPRFLVSYLTNIVLQTKFNRSLTVKMCFFPVQQQICSNKFLR